jgi:hypothetical protein
MANDPLPPWATLPDDVVPAAEDLVGGPVDSRLEAAVRWRLVLGKYSEAQLPLEGPTVHDGAGSDQANPSDLVERMSEAAAIDRTLEFIYDREFAKRAHRMAGAGEGHNGLTVPAWLAGVRQLFPREAVEVLEKDALTRYGLHELVTDPDVLRQATPSQDLVKAIMQFKHRMKGEVLEVAKQLVREVVQQLADQLKNDCAPALQGSHDPNRRPPTRTFRNVDWHRTIQGNLSRWDRDKERLSIDRVRYQHRQRGRGEWRIVIAVDQSGSMLDSVIHSAVMAGIFAALPSVTCHLVLWDHRMVDVSHIAHDPLEVLMGAQLGGGTLFLPALRYCADLVTEPRRTLLIVLSDWYLYGERRACLELAETLHESGVRCIGLCALDTDARPNYDHAFARKLAAVGWQVGAFTPKRLAEQVGKWIA